jgi:alpha-N-arabinofuranosidase
MEHGANCYSNKLISSRRELAWDNVESNQFGTDEFLKWCEMIETEPYIALNFGTGE